MLLVLVGAWSGRSSFSLSYPSPSVTRRSIISIASLTAAILVGMGYFVQTRWGDSESNPSTDRLREVLAELDGNDPEHPDVCLSHESDWTLTAFEDGLLVWENASEGEPQHMQGLSRERILELWLQLSRGDIAAIKAEPWLPGYGSRPPARPARPGVR